MAEKKETDDLEDLLPVAPGPYVDVLDVGELGDERGDDASFLADFAESGVGGLFTVIDQAFRKREDEFAGMLLAGRGRSGRGSSDGFGQRLAGRLVLRLDDGDVPRTLHAAQHDASGRKLANHGEEFTGEIRRRRWRLSGGYNRADVETIAKNVRFRRASDQSLLIYFDAPDTLVAHQRVAGLLRRLQEEPVHGVRNLHPAFRSLLVKFDASHWTHEELEAALQPRIDHSAEETHSEPRAVEIPVCYGGEFGPDLEEVARLHGMTVEEVIALHTGDSYVVFFLGFAPGFAYMGDLPESLATPRLITPRKVVLAGSVGIAGRQTGVYPFATPGGWRLLGRTPLKMFQRDRTGMCLLALGDLVKFVRISREHFRELESA